MVWWRNARNSMFLSHYELGASLSGVALLAKKSGGSEITQGGRILEKNCGM